mmetsp:Transcript_54279/g.112725  ORF Transcript_54279/g.112725 Transcript_54279/m.112725 type:complete len:226 (-) Transcript_54279:31-708(-)
MLASPRAASPSPPYQLPLELRPREAERALADCQRTANASLATSGIADAPPGTGAAHLEEPGFRAASPVTASPPLGDDLAPFSAARSDPSPPTAPPHVPPKFASKTGSSPSARPAALEAPAVLAGAAAPDRCSSNHLSGRRHQPSTSWTHSLGIRRQVPPACARHDAASPSPCDGTIRVSGRRDTRTESKKSSVSPHGRAQAPEPRAAAPRGRAPPAARKSTASHS